MKRGLISAIAALSLLSGSAAMAATSGASALSLAGGARAGASMSDEANSLEGGGLIGVAVFAAIVLAVFLVAEETDNPTSP